ncbi:MAG: alpha/beta fold hydrolase [Planctomycetota bacterium]
MTTTEQPWIAARGRSPNALARLFCLPHAGSGAVFYQSWCEGMPGIDVCRVQLPGRETRFVEPAVDDVHTLVPQIAAGIEPLLDRPFAIFGHSMGAVVGYELVRFLRERGKTPLAFFPSGHRAPHLPHPRPPVARTSDERFLAEVRWMGGTPEEFLSDPEMLEVILPTLRADVHLWESYRYQEAAPLTCSVVAFGGREDKVATATEIEPWSEHAAGTFACHIFDGDHFFLEAQRSDMLPILTTTIAAALRKSRSGQGG